ncbi:MAG: orotate phosphoribosyltransferase [Bacilli bacterium]
MKKTIAKHLLSIGAVELRPEQPFTWTSGIKSPIYCDNRLTLSFPEVRSSIANNFVRLIKEFFPETEVVAGTATAGIPHAAWVSERMDLPMVYVRSSAKAHGRGNQIEGRITPGQKVVVVEDLISTGGSVFNAVEALQKEGAEVVGVVAIFTYELEKATAGFKERNIEVRCLTNFSVLNEVAIEEGKIGQDSLAKIALWKQNPQDDSWLNA